MAHGNCKTWVRAIPPKLRKQPEFATYPFVAQFHSYFELVNSGGVLSVLGTLPANAAISAVNLQTSSINLHHLADKESQQKSQS